MRRKGVQVYNYSAGQPGFPPPEEALEIFINELRKRPFELSRYIATKGLHELREAISQDIKSHGGPDIDPEDILITTGGVEAVFLALNAVTDPNDRILLLDPSYSVYWGLTKYLDLKVVTCPQSIDREFQPDRKCIEEVFSKGIKVVLLVSPDNPTSRVISEDIAKLIVDLALDYDAWIIYDEAYKYIFYEGSHVWIQKYSGAYDITISVNTFSKDIAIPGFRLGYMYGPREVINQALKLKGYLSITSPVPAQYLALIALREGIKDEYLKKVLPIYRSRRDATYNALIKYLPEAKVWKPPAGMYLFPDITPYLEKLGMDDITFTYKLAEAKGVIMLPGSIFGDKGRNHLRITFVTQDEERLTKGIELLSEFIKEKELS